MSSHLNQFINMAKKTMNHAYANAKETIFAMTGTSSASVKQISEYVINHPDTEVDVHHYLGIPLSFYLLEQGQMKYYLETNNEKILQLDVHSNQHAVVSYRSYRDSLSLNTPVRFPDLHSAT